MGVYSVKRFVCFQCFTEIKLLASNLLYCIILRAKAATAFSAS